VRALKIPFCISQRGDLPAPLETAEPDVAPGFGLTLLIEAVPQERGSTQAIK
jgi:hypothetical protein